MADFRDGYRGVRTAVLGASGFVGRWVARLLCESGADAYLVARDATAAARVFARHGIDGEVLECDVRAPRALADLIARIRPAITFNLVVYGVDPVERDARAADELNAGLVPRLCSAVARARDRGWTGQELVHAGSQSEYGPLAGPLSEETSPGPEGAYARSKLAGTLRLLRGCRERGIRGVTARLFTVYGPGEHAGRLLPSLLLAARDGVPLPLTTGAQRRDFVYVADAAEALLRLGVSTLPAADVVNVATGRLVSVRRFAETAAEILRIDPENLEFGALPTRPDEMKHADVAPERLRRFTGWVPPTDVREGILRTKAFFDEHPDERH